MLQMLFNAFVLRKDVIVRRNDGKCVCGFVNVIQKEDGSSNKNFIVHMSNGSSLYFRLETDIAVIVS